MQRILGTWGFSKNEWTFHSKHPALQLEQYLHEAKELGFKILDTAPIYGLGDVESWIGRARVSQEFEISTKFGIDWSVPYDPGKNKIHISKDKIFSDCETSLKRLGKECIDYYFLHYPPFKWSEKDVQVLAETIAKLKREGKILKFGISNVNSEFYYDVKDHLSIDLVQFEYNLLKRWSEDKLEFFHSNEFSGSVWTYSPLARGLLSSKEYKLDELDDRDHRKKLKYFKNNEMFLELKKMLNEMSKRYECSMENFVLCWILNKRVGFQVIQGGRDVKCLKKMFKHVKISSQDMCKLDEIVV